MNSRHRKGITGFLSASLLIAACATGAWAHPEVFSDYSLEQAKQQAQKDNKFLIVDFMATWCPPCRKMESTTWTDSAVQSWIKENAIAVQIDVDKDRKASSAFNIEAMPTVVLLSQGGGKEFDRQVGFLDAGELLRWLKGAKNGKTSSETESDTDTQQSTSGGGNGSGGGGGGGNDVWSRISRARESQAAGKNEEALTEYVWLWSNISNDDPQLADVRRSLIPHELKTLFAAYPAAKTKFAEIRDAAEKSDNRGDWILLNGMLDDNARTLTWFDKAKTDPKQLDTFKKHTAMLELVLFSKSRYADAAKYLYPDPIAKVQQYYQRAQDMKKPRPDTEFAKDFDPFPSMVILMYGAYVGAGRDADAQKIFDECVRLDDTPDMRAGLDNMAKGMKQARAAATQNKTAN